MTMLRTLLALAALPLLATTAATQVQVRAGKDIRLPAGKWMTHLDGQVHDRSPLSFFVADGDGTTEDHLLRWQSGSGLTATGPLKNLSGNTYGWPSDLERINNTIYGIETFAKKLYTLDPTTGLCTDVGSATSYTRLFGLAYDKSTDKLYAVDQKTRKLLLFNRSTGAATVVKTLPSSFTDIRGLAFRPSDGKVYFCDDATETLQRIDLVSLVVEHVLDLNDGPDAKVDEIDFVAGKLFCSYRMYDSTTDIWSMQLALIDLDDEVAIPYGPVIDDCSAHSLLINSIPETIHWTQVDGPQAAHLINPGVRDPAVRFDVPGRYVFELRAQLFSKVVASDQVIVIVERGPNQPPGAGNPPQTTK